MMASKVPIVKDLVLLGGGHSHVEVLRSFGMRPMPGVRVTLVTRDVHTPYSGMLPGYISGFYTFDDCHIDLAKLTSWAQTRLVHAEATGLDIQKRRILFAGRPPLAYDVLSVDIGITPDSQEVPGARQHTVPVKPIDRFVSHLDLLLSRHAAREQPMRLVVVGGGAGGVEVALSMQHRLEQERVAAGRPASQQANISLVCRGPLLGSHTGYARRSFLAVLARKGVTLHEDCDVERVEAGALMLREPAGGAAQTAGGQGAAPTRIEFDECLWCTQASPAAWLKATGLPTDASGFLAINECLQSDQGPPEVFAAGDVASCAKHPRPKAGVYAVRQGPPLAANLRHYLSGEPMQPFLPQATNLALITTGDKYCVGTKGWLGLQGAYLWNWKDSIDRAFMRKYGEDLEVMRARMMAQQKPGSGSEAQTPAIAAAGPEALALLAESKMRCGGCGSKVGASVLSRALARLPPGPAGAAGIVAGLDSPDDAAILRPPPAGKLLLQTVDFLRSFCQDAYEFGQVVANHALGDVWAMGGRPTSALAVVVLPLMTEALMEEELTLLMAGAQKVLAAAGCSIVGGHTCEGAELSLGFSVTGEVDEGRVLRKNGLKAGQVLVLTKGLGVGVIMAAHMRCKAKGRHVTGALASMIESSQEAAAVLLAHGATAATDVTGFGLVGHLVEMTRPSEVSVTLDWRAVPWLAGAADALQDGVTSSIHTQNAKAAAAVGNFQQLQQAEPVLWPILVDPQTGGGLLAGIPADQAQACVNALQAAGYSQACIVGTVTAPGDAPITVSL